MKHLYTILNALEVAKRRQKTDPKFPTPRFAKGELEQAHTLNKTLTKTVRVTNHIVNSNKPVNESYDKVKGQGGSFIYY